jgi:hypothetical protein
VAAGQADDEPFAFEATQVVGGLPAGVGPVERGAGELDKRGVVEPGKKVAEPDDGGHHRHYAGIPTPQPGSVLATAGGRPGHLSEGDHIRSGTGIGSLCVTQTLVGGFANRPKGIPVLGGNPPTDTKVPGVADHRFGARAPDAP